MGGARLGLAENLSVAGKTDDALAALRSLREKDAGSYAAPFRRTFWKAASRCGAESSIKRARFSPILFPAIPRSPAAHTAGAQLDAIVPFLPPRPEETKD